MDFRLKQLNLLHTFESAARHQSYSKAAEELFVSQAAISQQMRQLEAKLNTSLFVRSGRSMLLTIHGETLYRACHQGFLEIASGLNAIQSEGLAGDLTITSTQAFCSLWLMPRLYKFSLLYPDINIRVLASNAVQDMKKKHIDIAIRFSLSIDQLAADNMVVEPCGHVSAYPVCSAELFNRGDLTSPQELLNYQLIYLANESKVTWGSWFEHVGVTGYKQHKKKTEVTSTDLALSAVLGGHGITLAATELFAPYLSTKQVVVPFDIKHPIEWQRFILYDAHSSRANRIKVFTEWLKQELTSNAQEVG